MDDSGISVESLQHDLLRLFNEWNTLGNDHPLAYLEIARAGPGQSPSAVIKQILHNLILRLEKEWASVLQRRFFDGLSAAQTAVGLSMAESTVFRKQREAIGHLAQLLYAEEELARAERLAHFYQRLEAPTYQQLFGADEQIDEILVTLESPASPWIGSSSTAVTLRLLAATWRTLSMSLKGTRTNPPTSGSKPACTLRLPVAESVARVRP